MRPCCTNKNVTLTCVHQDITKIKSLVIWRRRNRTFRSCRIWSHFCRCPHVQILKFRALVPSLIYIKRVSSPTDKTRTKWPSKWLWQRYACAKIKCIHYFINPESISRTSWFSWGALFKLSIHVAFFNFGK